MFGPTPLSTLAISLDAPSFEPLEPLLDELEDRPVLAGIGAALMAGVGPSVVQHLRNSGLISVLDLRLFDDPHRMALLVEVAARARVAGLTVHLAAGEASVRSAVAAARGRLPIVGVLSPHWLPDPDAVAAAATMAERCGVAGVMGTPAALQAVGAQRRFGLRWATQAFAKSCASSDVVTYVEAAIEAASTTVFVGGAVLQASDPGAVIDQISAQLSAEVRHGRSTR